MAVKTDAEKSEVLTKNGTLLKFAGFTIYSSPMTSSITYRGWAYPNGTPAYNPPDLLHSLDAQAKWLWPKIRGMKHGKYRLYKVLFQWVTNKDFDFSAEACAELTLVLAKEEGKTQ